MEEIQNKAVPSGPFWLSQANTEFGQNGWASNITAAAGLGGSNIWLSNLAGKSNVTHQFTIGTQGNGWFGLRDVSGAPVFGEIVPRSVAGAPSLTEFIIRQDNPSWSWISVYGWHAGRIRASIPNGPSADFIFRNDSESMATEGDITGLSNYIIARNGQTIGIDIYSV
jgi:hypothetical protein